MQGPRMELKSSLEQMQTRTGTVECNRKNKELLIMRPTWNMGLDFIQMEIGSHW